MYAGRISKYPSLVLWLGLVLVASFLVCDPAWAEEERVFINAGEFGSYYPESQIFVARGDVELNYGDLTLWGDELHADLASGELLLVGSVRLRQGTEEFTGVSLLYNLETGEGVFDEARAEVPLDKGAGTVFLFGEAINFEGANYSIIGGTFTTCDLPESHYHVRTKQVEVIPHEKMIIRGVTYYEGKIPLFYWPYLVIPLDMTENEFFTLPIFGYSDFEGYFMKNTFNYHISAKGYGNIYLDIFTRLGIGLGVRHVYDLESWGKGQVRLYQLFSGVSPLSEGALNHTWKKDGWSLSTNTTLTSGASGRKYSSTNKFGVVLPKLSASAQVILNGDPTDKTKNSRKYLAQWSQTLLENWRLNLSGSWTEQQKLSGLERFLDYKAETSYRKAKHTLVLTVEQQHNPDLLTDEIPKWRNLQRIPELKWDLSDLGLTKLPLSSQIMLGRYGEQPYSGSQVVQDTRAYAKLSLKPRLWRPFSKTSVNYQADLSSAFYGSGERQSSFYGRVILNQSLTDRLRLNSTYTRRDVWGASPFRFDTLNPANGLLLNLTYTASKWQATAKTEYSFLSKTFGDLTLSGNWRPGKGWRLDLSTSYNFYSRQVTSISPSLEYKEGQNRFKVSAVYKAGGLFESIQASLSLPIGQTWRVSYDSTYKGVDRKFTKGQVVLTKDLHCRALSLSYDHVNKRTALQFTIKAFPELPLGWDSKEGFSMFDLEKWQPLLRGSD